MIVFLNVRMCFSVSDSASLVTLSIAQYLLLISICLCLSWLAMFSFHIPFCLKNSLIQFSRNTLLEQLSRLPHAPSVPFQTTPPITEVPEEVGSL